MQNRGLGGYEYISDRVLCACSRGCTSNLSIAPRLQPQALVDLASLGFACAEAAVYFTAHPTYTYVRTADSSR